MTSTLDRSGDAARSPRWLVPAGMSVPLLFAGLSSTPLVAAPLCAITTGAALLGAMLPAHDLRLKRMKSASTCFAKLALGAMVVLVVVNGVATTQARDRLHCVMRNGGDIHIGATAAEFAGCPTLGRLDAFVRVVFNGYLLP